MFFRSRQKVPNGDSSWGFVELFYDGVFFGRGYLGRQGLGRFRLNRIELGLDKFGLDNFISKVIILGLRSLGRVSILEVIGLVNPATSG